MMGSFSSTIVVGVLLSIFVSVIIAKTPLDEVSNIDMQHKDQANIEKVEICEEKKVFIDIIAKDLSMGNPDPTKFSAGSANARSLVMKLVNNIAGKVILRKSMSSC